MSPDTKIHRDHGMVLMIAVAIYCMYKLKLTQEPQLRILCVWTGGCRCSLEELFDEVVEKLALTVYGLDSRSG